jgi:hypothetical protein
MLQTQTGKNRFARVISRHLRPCSLSPEIARIVCCDRAYDRPPVCPRVSDPATHCSSTPRIPTPCGCSVARPSPRSRDTESRNIRAEQDLTYGQVLFILSKPARGHIWRTLTRFSSEWVCNIRVYSEWVCNIRVYFFAELRHFFPIGSQALETF